MQRPQKKLALAIDANLVQDNIPVEVVRNLYIGSLHAAFNQEWLVENGITHVLNASRFPPSFPRSFTYLSVDIRDKESANLLACLPATNIFIEAGMEAGGILVHCGGGRSRSAAFIAAYLMSSMNESFEKVYSMIRSARSVASINVGFITQLRAYEASSHDVYTAQQILLRRRLRQLREKRKASKRKGVKSPVILGGIDKLQPGVRAAEDREMATQVLNSSAHKRALGDAEARSSRKLEEEILSGGANGTSASPLQPMTSFRDPPLSRRAISKKTFFVNTAPTLGGHTTQSPLPQLTLPVTLQEPLDLNVCFLKGEAEGVTDGTSGSSRDPLEESDCSDDRNSPTTKDKARPSSGTVDTRAPRMALSRPGSGSVRVIPPVRGLERNFSCCWCASPLFCLGNVVRLNADVLKLVEKVERPLADMVVAPPAGAPGGHGAESPRGPRGQLGRLSEALHSSSRAMSIDGDGEAEKDSFGDAPLAPVAVSRGGTDFGSTRYVAPPQSTRAKGSKAFDFADDTDASPPSSKPATPLPLQEPEPLPNLVRQATYETSARFSHQNTSDGNSHCDLPALAIIPQPNTRGKSSRNFDASPDKTPSSLPGELGAGGGLSVNIPPHLKALNVRRMNASNKNLTGSPVILMSKDAEDSHSPLLRMPSQSLSRAPSFRGAPHQLGGSAHVTRMLSMSRDLGDPNLQRRPSSAGKDDTFEAELDPTIWLSRPATSNTETTQLPSISPFDRQLSFNQSDDGGSPKPFDRPVTAPMIASPLLGLKGKHEAQQERMLPQLAEAVSSKTASTRGSPLVRMTTSKFPIAPLQSLQEEESPRITIPPEPTADQVASHTNLMTAEKKRWMARFGLLRPHDDLKVTKLAKADEDVSLSLLGDHKYVHIEYLDWIGEEPLCSDNEQGPVECYGCRKVIGTWFWNPSSKQSHDGILEPPVFRLSKSCVREVGMVLDNTPEATPRKNFSDVETEPVSHYGANSYYNNGLTPNLSMGCQ